jgi:hypothetical protein
MQTPSQAQVIAAGRHVLTAAASIVAFASVMHLISGDEAGKINDALSQIGAGVASIATGVGTLVTVLSGIWAAYTASTSHQVAAVGALATVPGSGVAGVITTQTPEGRALAASVPGPTVVQAGTSIAASIAVPNKT